MLALALPKKKGKRWAGRDRWYGLETELATGLMPMSKVTERKYISAVGIASAVGLAISSMLREKASALGFVLPVFMIAATILLIVYNGKGRKEALPMRVKHVRWFALFGVIAVVLAAPQLFGFTFKQSVNNDSFLRWGFNWCNVSDSWLCGSISKRISDSFFIPDACCAAFRKKAEQTVLLPEHSLYGCCAKC